MPEESPRDVLAPLRGADLWLTPSNAISAIRVLLVAPAVIAIVDRNTSLAIVLFVLAYLSDLLDGYLARRLHEVSEIGKVIDPLADKLFVAGAVIALLAVGLIPVWFVAAVLLRDLMILLAGLWAKRKLGLVLPSNYSGKAAVVSVGLVLLLALIGVSRPLFVFVEVLSIVLMAVSLASYGWRLRSLLTALKH